MIVETHLFLRALVFLLRVLPVAFISVLLLLTVSFIISLLLLLLLAAPSVAEVGDEQRSEAVAELDVPAEEDLPPSGPQRGGGKPVSTPPPPLTCIFWGHWGI